MTDECLPAEDPTLGPDMTRKFERLVSSGKNRVNDDIVRTVLLRPAPRGPVLQTQWQTPRHTIVKSEAVGRSGELNPPQSAPYSKPPSEDQPWAAPLPRLVAEGVGSVAATRWSSQVPCYVNRVPMV